MALALRGDDHDLVVLGVETDVVTGDVVAASTPDGQRTLEMLGFVKGGRSGVAQVVRNDTTLGDASNAVAGTGTSMAANKVPGVRAALAWDPWIAEGARKWNDANVLVMSLKRTDPEAARAIVDAWLSVDAPDPDEAENIARLRELEQSG